MHPQLQNPKVRQQAEQILSQMTLEQKIGQMTQADRLTCSPQDAKKYHLGSILSGAGSCPEGNRPQDWVDMNDAYWHASMEVNANQVAIPILYGLDAIHGNNNVKGATIFPHNIGLGATHDSVLLDKIADICAKEVLASGVDWAFAPNLAVVRDKHWGRSYESYSENPDIVSNYAKSMVNGLQKQLAENSVIACVKHWVGDGGTSYGIDQGDTRLSEAELFSTHIKPYYQAMQAGALTVMASFSSWNGKKCHAHHYLLTEILKGKLGFDGFVVSDMQGIDYLSDDFYLAVEKGVNAGIDMFMLPENWKLFIEHLKHHVEIGTVSIERINNAVFRILSVKVAFGLFDKPCPSERKFSNDSSFGSIAHREVAREAVRKSQVLLKNQKQILPLDKASKIVVAGKNANNRGHQCGGFTIEWQGVSGNEHIVGGTSIWEGITQVAHHAVLSETTDGSDIEKENCDLAVVVIGEKPYAEGMGDIREGDNIIVEAGSLVDGQLNVLEPYGNTLELQHLHPEDITLLQSIAAKDIPIVVILVSGRPLVINAELALSDAFIASWLPGSEGQGVSDVLFGDFDFQGKLAVSWPKATHPTMNHGDKNYKPLFPYGFGLTYQKQK